jgi:hypothetical protein
MRPPGLVASRRRLPMMGGGGALRQDRACDTRFRNGSSVTGCIYRLTCCFALFVRGWTRGHFTLPSCFELLTSRLWESGPGAWFDSVHGEMSKPWLALGTLACLAAAVAGLTLHPTTTHLKVRFSEAVLCKYCSQPPGQRSDLVDQRVAGSTGLSLVSIASASPALQDRR